MSKVTELMQISEKAPIQYLNYYYLTNYDAHEHCELINYSVLGLNKNEARKKVLWRPRLVKHGFLLFDYVSWS